MTTVRMEGGRQIPWRPIIVGAVWLVSILIVGGILFWLWWECREREAALQAEVVALNQQHAADVAALVDRIAELEEEKAALEAIIVELDDEVDYLQSERERLLQQNDILLARLGACLDELNRPRPVEVVVPGLIRDDAATVLVIDDSGSMAASVPSVQEALRGIQAREDELPSARISVVTFGSSVQTLSGVTSVGLVPWDYAVGEIDGNSGGSNIHLALETAYEVIKDLPQEQKRIVLLSDGRGDIAPALISNIAQEGIKIDTVPFGAYADVTLLQGIADQTGGAIARAN